MLSLFKKIKKAPASTAKSIGGALGKELQKKVLIVQEKWVQWMIRKTSKLSHGRLLLLLVFFVIFSAGYCIALIVNGFFGSSASSLTITPIVTLGKQVQTTDPKAIKDSARSKEEFEE
jgi:hypothetical protein